MLTCKKSLIMIRKKDSATNGTQKASISSSNGSSIPQKSVSILEKVNGLAMSDNGYGHFNSKKNSLLRSSQLMQLLEDGLREIFWAENAQVKAIPTLIRNATSKELIAALASHLDDTRLHVSRLKKVFDLVKVKAEERKCDTMEGLIYEAFDIMESHDQGSVLDAGIIAATQKLENYEISAYRTLCKFAETLELYGVVELLKATLEEEKEADLKFSDVAMADLKSEDIDRYG
jgi:ferritin-like metal-binding protein YciE